VSLLTVLVITGHRTNFSILRSMINEMKFVFDVHAQLFSVRSSGFHI
jgi:hypothetical protein